MASTRRGHSRLRDPWYVAAVVALLASAIGLVWGGYVYATRPAPSTQGLNITIPAPREYDYLNVSIIGDSYTDGVGVNSRGLSYSSRAAQSQCWNINRVAQSGTGYTNPGSRADTRPYTEPERIRNALYGEPDLIIVQGSTNDEKRPGVRAAALDVLSELRRQAPPETEVVAVGPTIPPDTDPAAIRTVRDEVASAAAEAGVPFIDPIERRWLTANGVYATDGLHPNDAGHLEFADDLVTALRETGLVAGDSCAPVTPAQ